MTGDAVDVWDGSCAPGGNVCAACGMPTESEPCRVHQPAAYAEIDGPSVSGLGEGEPQ